MSGANILLKRKSLVQSVTLGLYFQYYLHRLIYDFIDVPANVTAKVSASSLTAEEKDILTNILIPKYTQYTDKKGREVTPAYLMNTEKLLGDFALLAKLANTQGTPDPDLASLVGQYNDPRRKYLMSDEDEYKIPAEFVRLYLKAEQALSTKVDSLNV